MKNFTSSARFVVVAFFAVFVLSLVAFAAKGPCSYTKNPGTGDGIDCVDNYCDGTVILDPGCQDCANQNESDCEPGPTGTIVMYATTGARCRTAGECGINPSSKAETSSGCPADCL